MSVGSKYVLKAIDWQLRQAIQDYCGPRCIDSGMVIAEHLQSMTMEKISPLVDDFMSNLSKLNRRGKL